MAATKKKKGLRETADGRQVIATNRRARHDYNLIDTYEAGVVLVGTEVKSLRAGKASLVDAFATIDDGEVWLRGLHIPEYSHGSWTNHAPKRARNARRSYLPGPRRGRASSSTTSGMSSGCASMAPSPAILPPD